MTDTRYRGEQLFLACCLSLVGLAAAVLIGLRAFDRAVSQAVSPAVTR